MLYNITVSESFTFFYILTLSPKSRLIVATILGYSLILFKRSSQVPVYFGNIY